MRTRYLKKLRPVLDKIPNRVIYTGNLTQEQMIEPYSYCDLFAAVSTYEGFFLPLIEAMACRAPVLCAKVGVLPEVGADVPFYYKPDDVQDLQDKLRFLLKSREIYRGSEQEKKGLQRAELFSSSNAAKAYLKVFENDKIHKNELELLKDNKSSLIIVFQYLLFLYFQFSFSINLWI